MPVKVQILVSGVLNNLPTREIEIPDACPYCGADLASPGCTIREAGFVWYSSPAFINKVEGEADSIEADGFQASFDETTMRVGYLCNECDGDLTAAPEDHPDKCHCEGTTCPGFKEIGK